MRGRCIVVARIGNTAAMDNGAYHYELDKSVRGKLLVSAIVSQSVSQMYYDHLVDARHVFFLPLLRTT